MSVTTVRLQPEIEESLEAMAGRRQAQKEIRWAETLKAMASVAQGKVVSGDAIHSWLRRWLFCASGIISSIMNNETGDSQIARANNLAPNKWQEKPVRVNLGNNYGQWPSPSVARLLEKFARLRNGLHQPTRLC